MGDHAVVLYDDGVYASIPSKKIRSSNGKYSAKWKNIYYNVNLVKTGTKATCDLFISSQKQVELGSNISELIKEIFLNLWYNCRNFIKINLFTRYFIFGICS